MDLWDYIDDNKDNDIQISEREFEIEHEFEQAYGVPYGKYISRMDIKYFDTEEYRQAFNKLSLSRDICESIYKYSKQSILDNWGTNKESMFLLDMDKNELIASIEKDEDKIDFGVSYSEEFRNSLNNAIEKGIRIIAIHNHPHGYPPSLDDISKIAENHYETAIVAGANGLIYQYYNPQNKIFFDKEAEIYHDMITLNIEAGYDIDRAHKEVYDTLGLSYDVIEGSEIL